MPRTDNGGVSRRTLLAAAAATIAAPSIVRAQTLGGAKPRSSRDRLEEVLIRIADPKGEGKRACLTVYTEAARAAADVADARARDGISLGPLDGAIVTIKDLFDVKGEPTRAGSTILANARPALEDATAVRRLRAAGAVIVAKTNMVEFAFAIHGLNPHYGTPGNPADRARLPGGSSSGAAVAVADGMCEIAIGTDTGGSCRAPAAFCGTVGFKPTKSRVPTDGAFPLSYTLDSIGSFAMSVARCAAADAVMAGEDPWRLEPLPLSGLRLGIVQGAPLENLDDTVTGRFSEALSAIGRGGARLSDETIMFLNDANRLQARARFSSIEAFAIHRQGLAARGADYDPFVRARIELGRDFPAADYITMLRGRQLLARGMEERLAGLDALVLPTTPQVAPMIADVSAMSTEAALATDLLLGRNVAIVNFFDLCAISLPIPRESGLPAGLMLVARNGQDRKLFAIAAAVERLFAA
jgi:aspartyl-tRNA(Asn)/glutamyl-tRNA(Gln) amidotransferase subunit A